MKNLLSTYKCEYCRLEVQAAPATRRGCPRCNQPMKEVVLGIVTKGANTDEDKKSEFTKPTLMSPDVAVNMPEAELRDLARVYNVENCEKMKLDKLREVMKGILSKKQTENKANE